MRIIVTGGAGFIGSAMCRFLINNTEATLINLDKMSYASSNKALESISNNERYYFQKLDICDKQELNKVFEIYQPQAVINFAAETHVDRSIDNPIEFINTNIVGTYNLLEVSKDYFWKSDSELKKKFRLLHISTDEVYGSLGDSGLFNEDSPYSPTSPYSASKASSDHLVKAYYHTYGLPTLISNCSNNYGPYQFPEKLIPLMVIKGIKKQEMPVYGNGLNIRDWLYVEDHVEALYSILLKGKIGDKYNIGGNSEKNNLQIVKAICKILDEELPWEGKTYESLIRHVEDRPGHDFRYAIDTTKIQKELNWSPKFNFEEGLKKTVKWYLENSWRWDLPENVNVYDYSRLGVLSCGL